MYDIILILGAPHSNSIFIYVLKWEEMTWLCTPKGFINASVECPDSTLMLALGHERRMS